MYTRETIILQDKQYYQQQHYFTISFPTNKTISRVSRKVPKIEIVEKTQNKKKKENWSSFLWTTIFKTVIALFVKQFVTTVLKELLKELGKNVENNYIKILLNLGTKTSINIISTIFSYTLTSYTVKLLFKQLKKKIAIIISNNFFKGLLRAMIAKCINGYAKIFGKKIKRKSRKIRKMFKKSKILKTTQNIYQIIQETETAKKVRKSCKYIMKGKFKKLMKKKKKRFLRRIFYIQNQIEKVDIRAGVVEVPKKNTQKMKQISSFNFNGTLKQENFESCSFRIIQAEFYLAVQKIVILLNKIQRFLFGPFSTHCKYKLDRRDEQKFRNDKSNINLFPCKKLAKLFLNL